MLSRYATLKDPGLGGNMLTGMCTNFIADTFEEDATFILREDVWFENTISLESVNRAGVYIMQSEYELKALLLQDAPETFAEDASFKSKWQTSRYYL